MIGGTREKTEEEKEPAADAIVVGPVCGAVVGALTIDVLRGAILGGIFGAFLGCFRWLKEQSLEGRRGFTALTIWAVFGAATGATGLTIFAPNIQDLGNDAIIGGILGALGGFWGWLMARLFSEVDTTASDYG